MTKPADDVFEVEAFWTDVEKYMIRHKMTNMDMAHALWIDPSQFHFAMKNKRSVSLRWAVLISKYCDLDLNSYIK